MNKYLYDKLVNKFLGCKQNFFGTSLILIGQDGSIDLVY